MLFQKKLKSKLICTLGLVACLFTLIACKGGDGENIEIPGVQGPHITLSEDRIEFTSIFENVITEVGVRTPIPEYGDSFVEIGPDFETGGTLFKISVSMNDILNGDLDLLDPQTLPGGRPLPGVKEGELPAVAFSIPQFQNVRLFLGPKVYGIFLPFQNGIEGAIVTSRYYIEGKKAGTMSLVGMDENKENSGFLVMLKLSKKVRKFLRKRIRKYRNRH